MTTSAADRPSLAGKTGVVTGATAGIGRVTAEELAKAGASVWIVGRNREKCAAEVVRLRTLTGNPSVDALVGDLSSQAEVRRLAGELQERCPKLDVLVNNAGAMFTERRLSADGIEMTWALNHLSYFLFTNLLLDSLRAAGKARVVNVASDAHRMVRGIDFNDPQGAQRYRALRAYGQSKLANILFSNELARRLAGTGVTSNALHPGLVRTSFFDEKGRAWFWMRLGAQMVGIAPEAGARTSIHLATSPAVEGVTGGYFQKARPAKPSAAALDAGAAGRLWTLSEAMTGLATAS